MSPKMKVPTIPKEFGAYHKCWPLNLMIESKVLSQVLEILLNQLKCFVSRLPRKNHEQKSRIIKNHKANGASRECQSLAMRCVALALSETWTLNLIEKCGQKPMKTQMAITRCSTAQFSTNNPMFQTDCSLFHGGARNSPGR